MANILDCKVASLPMKYLGFHLGVAYFKAKSVWEGVLEMIDRKLAGWKHIYLLKRGRLTLIKSTVSNLLTYYLDLFPLPSSVTSCIEKIFLNFLWRSIGAESKFILLSGIKCVSHFLLEVWGCVI